MKEIFVIQNSQVQMSRFRLTREVIFPYLGQGDQMSLRKYGQKCRATYILSKIDTELERWENVCSPQICATTVIKKLPKSLNRRKFAQSGHPVSDKAATPIHVCAYVHTCPGRIRSHNQ
jgi:hypothetical protein